MYRISIVVFIVVASLILWGCQHGTGLKNKSIGAIAGAVVGGVAGHKIADGKNEKLWTVGGAWLGSQIGQYLDEKDRQKMTESSQKAMITGEKQTWSNPETKVSGSAEVVSEKSETVEVTVPVLKGRVKQVPPLDMIGQPYQVTKTSNVRGGPGKDYEILETIAQGTTVDVIGKVQGKSWMMIGFNNTGSGFMHSSLLKTVPVEQRKAQISAPEVKAAEIDKKTINAKRTCRTVKQVITLEDGSEKVENITACQGPNGWETI
ncbi:MAG: glycine zipper 2TM domain-containing protein [Deltaproteobacteria bacterium]|nr:glycine zipper 2TM domain-containing protein [Deltaproteobacteria bacterium]